MELQGEDLDLYNRLKDKYASMSSTEMPSDPNAPGAELWQPPAMPVQTTTRLIGSGKGSDVEAKMCPICQGSGLEIQLYNHRRLEKYCSACQGKGVMVYKNGVEVKEPETSDVHVPPDIDDQGSMADAHKLSDDDAALVHKELASIAQKLASYQAEEAGLQASLTGCTDSEEVKLRQALVTQVTKHIKTLRSARAKKEAQLLLAGRKLVVV